MERRFPHDITQFQTGAVGQYARHSWLIRWWSVSGNFIVHGAHQGFQWLVQNDASIYKQDSKDRARQSRQSDLKQQMISQKAAVRLQVISTPVWHVDFVTFSSKNDSCRCYNIWATLITIAQQTKDVLSLSMGSQDEHSPKRRREPTEV